MADETRPRNIFELINKNIVDSPTQKIPTIYDVDLEKNAERRTTSSETRGREKN